MHVVATAGHVDHGKSTLVRALTGMEPDRYAEEQRRGMTIDLGFAWTTLPGGATLALVDVPGHERFVGTMLAGAGPVPAALFVVAADGGWMPQSAEHLAALDALGVRHGLLVVTRADLAPPDAALAQARARLARTSLGELPAVAVSAVTGAGLPELRAALDRLTAALPPPDAAAPVRLWVDRAFTVTGAGTVVTGTLGAGTLRTGDTLDLGGRSVRVRGLQTLGAAADRLEAVARVAVNLRGVDRAGVRRGDALLTPGEWAPAQVIDVRVHPPTAGRPNGAGPAAGSVVGGLPPHPILHVGAAAVGARVRPLGGDVVRLRLERPLPLRAGDRALLRDPGTRVGAGDGGSAGLILGVTVLDVAPPALTRRGAAARRAADLAAVDLTAVDLAAAGGRPGLAGELRRRGLARRADLRRWGVDPAGAEPVAGDWLADPAHWAALRERAAAAVERWQAAHPLEPGMPVEALRHALGLPDRELVAALAGPALLVADGRVRPAGSAGPALPAPVAAAVDAVLADLAAAPFAAPEAHRLAALGLGPRQLAAAVRAGALLRVADGVVLAPGAVERAAEVLGCLPQPFTLSAARQALGTTRRVAVPLLELLDRSGVTRRLPDDRRELA
ncbi:selenocysteine-specific translation elongation factor [Spirilliplanes yamanashiensis]|uniref:Selenocysteine-specific translation elongation factor n=1 Tax=Spirilliplanes yamanashiensis TaxID=42233 RepID=A0A8J3YAU6_9ACTN|nr:selenocysteine-specific translation elongation factor [Spirilliplanes yamanashiensis]MDP9817699.1 selenocysteine-specific elongation factor [Spirilliplanes yamanashiensis]GIJ04509.1 selenocysteine-specific translation elongation factor [Spirilliplanes yamanashiensis]